MKVDFEQFKTIHELRAHIMAEKNCDGKAADRWIKDYVPKESYFQDKILKYLKDRYRDSVVKKYNSGAYDQGGMPDILFILHGRYYGFEVKRPYFGKVSKLQEETIKQIRRAGGVAEVVTYISEVENVIRRETNE